MQETRAERYKNGCVEILFKTKSLIIKDDTKVFVITNNQKIFLLKINNLKTAWFEVWIKLRDEK